MNGSKENTHYKKVPLLTSKYFHVATVALSYSILYLLFFSPAILAGKLLAPGDGLIQSVPAFYSPRTLWSDLILSGFPVAADPTVQTWYPLSILFKQFPHSWNAYVISAYILASCFSYGYVYCITRSKTAGAVSGIVYGMSGFMLAHLGHTTMIHSAVWMPLVIWSLHRLIHETNIRWTIVGSLSIAACLLAGHPQVSVYGLGLATAYALIMGVKSRQGIWSYYKTFLLILLTGFAIALIQLIPTIQLMSLGLRQEFQFKDFVTYSLPLNQIPQLLFPYLFGGGSELYAMPDVGKWGLTETTGFVGILPIILALVGIISYPDKILNRFWVIVLFLTFLLALGEATPLAGLMFHIPVYNKFRAPARHLIEMTMAVSVLAGMGVVSIKNNLASFRILNRVLLGIVCIFPILALSVSSIYLNNIQTAHKLAGQTSEIKQYAVQSIAIIAVPLALLCISLLFIFIWVRKRRSKFLSFLAVLLVILDLGSFGWFSEWKLGSPDQTALEPRAHVLRYQERLLQDQQRFLPIRGGLGSTADIPVNISRMWNIPSASGYGPLILTRVSEMLSMSTNGSITWTASKEGDRSFDLLGVRYISLPTDTSEFGNSVVLLGNGCSTENPKSTKLLVAPNQIPSHVVSLNIVSSLACSTAISNNEKVLQIKLRDKDGQLSEINLAAGKDTSEWAYDCKDVKPLMKHERAQVFKSYPIKRRGFKKCKGHSYVSTFPLSKLNRLVSVEFNWLAKAGSISVQEIDLVGEDSEKSHPITYVSSDLANTSHWKYIETVDSDVNIYENLTAMPRAWLVQRVKTLSPSDILQTIKSSRLPDGSYYDPSKVALVEENFEFVLDKADSTATTEIFPIDSDNLRINTQSTLASFLVLSDIYYPGWRVKVDGKDEKIFQTNYLSRGVFLTPGKHTVDFRFAPRSFEIGLAISLSSCSFLLYLFLRSFVLTREKTTLRSNEK